MPCNLVMRPLLILAGMLAKNEDGNLTPDQVESTQIIYSGGTVVFTGSPAFDPGAITRALASHAVTVLNCAPSAFYALLDQVGDFATLASLRYLFLGGEPIQMPRLRAWLRDPAAHPEWAIRTGGQGHRMCLCPTTTPGRRAT